MGKVYCKNCIHLHETYDKWCIYDHNASYAKLNKYESRVECITRNKEGDCKFYQEIKAKRKWWKIWIKK